MVAPVSWARVDKGRPGNPSSAGRYEFQFFAGASSSSLIARRRPGAEGLRKVTERGLPQGWLHVVVPDWRASEAVTRCNSIDCPINHVLYSWVDG
jgi:hypothetical protein